MAANPSPAPTLNMDVDTTVVGATIRCSGKITSESCPLLRAMVKPMFSDKKSVVLDFTDVSYMDSSGLGTIVGLYISAKAANCQFQLINLTGRVKDLFRLTRLGEVDRSLVPDLWRD